MTKDEYISMLNTNIAINSIVSGFSEKASGKIDGLKKAIDLAEKLDEPKKVVIPQFVADWIEEAKLYSGNEVDPLGIIYWMGDYIGSKEPHCEWLKNIYNQKLLLNAIVNGYEVED